MSLSLNGQFCKAQFLLHLTPVKESNTALVSSWVPLLNFTQVQLHLDKKPIYRCRIRMSASFLCNMTNLSVWFEIIVLATAFLGGKICSILNLINVQKKSWRKEIWNLNAFFLGIAICKWKLQVETWYSVSTSVDYR